MSANKYIDFITEFLEASHTLNTQNVAEKLKTNILVLDNFC